MNIVGIIPARMASTRFPDKPLVDILGMPMIGHCYFRSKMSPSFSEVYVATCDQEIVDYVESVGGKAVMTADTHERATDRTAEAIQKIEMETGEKIDVVVMLQGDEPMVTIEMIESVIKPMVDDRNLKVSNLMTKLKSKDEHEDPNEVKVVVDKFGHALYFSREPIPSRKKGIENVPMQKQIGLIAFDRDFLMLYNEMEQTPLEIIESVDMMRVLENGYKIKMVLFEGDTYGVDNQVDLENVINLMKSDPMLKSYL